MTEIQDFSTLRQRLGQEIAVSDWFEMPGSLIMVKLCRISGLLATDRCHLPVYETPPYDPNDPEASQTPIYREGGVFEDFRNVGRMPEICPLAHGEPPPYERTLIDGLLTTEPERSPTLTPGLNPPPAMNPPIPNPAERRPPPLPPPPGNRSPGNEGR